MRRVIPGFGLTLGYTMVYLSLLVLIPLSATFIRSFGSGWGTIAGTSAPSNHSPSVVCDDGLAANRKCAPIAVTALQVGWRDDRSSPR